MDQLTLYWGETLTVTGTTRLDVLNILYTKKNKKGRLVSFKKDLSWDRETKEFINALKKNQKIKTGNIEDAKKVMNLVDKIYKSDKSWKY